MSLVQGTINNEHSRLNTKVGLLSYILNMFTGSHGILNNNNNNWYNVSDQRHKNLPFKGTVQQLIKGRAFLVGITCLAKSVRKKLKVIKVTVFLTLQYSGS